MLLFPLQETSTDELSTQRLRLRPLRRADVTALDAAIQETLPELVRWLSWAKLTHDRQETRRYIRGARAAHAERRAFEFVVEDVAGGSLLGITSLHRIDWLRSSAGLGYWVRRSSWSKGVATEAALCLIDHAFTDLGLNRLEMHIAPDNSSSLRVADKLGFLREGVARQSELLGDRFQDHVQYSLLHSDRVPGESERRV